MARIRSMVKKPFVNKRTKQLSVSLSKKEMKRIDPTLKFDENLFVKIQLLRRKKK